MVLLPRLFFLRLLKNTRKTLYSYCAFRVCVKTRCFYQMRHIYEENTTILQQQQQMFFCETRILPPILLSPLTKQQNTIFFKTDLPTLKLFGMLKETNIIFV